MQVEGVPKVQALNYRNYRLLDLRITVPDDKVEMGGSSVSKNSQFGPPSCRTAALPQRSVLDLMISSIFGASCPAPL